MTQLTAPNANTIADIPKRGMPVTIITGFLGSGKTTLLNQILKNKQDLKVAVLVNEFGDINIDSQLLVSIDEDMLELSNGCICCTINDGLVDAVYRVLEREERIDYLVIETTGVADPLPIILTFLGTELRDLTHLDSILTLVDSEAFNHEHFLSEAALKQITYGDIVLLNKTDLVTQQKLEELEAYIREVKAGAKILHTTYGQVPLPLILGVDLTPKDEYSSLIEEKHEHHHDHNHEHHHHHRHHSHHLENDGFISISFQSDRPFDVHKFEKFLNEEIPQDIFRAKGILWFSDSNLRHIFQLSGPRYSLNGDEWLTSPKNQLVFIGRNLDVNEITSLLNQCLA
ncbi:cobalamin biosynthesis protein CobW [Fischerella thermalis CCMEE 5273]|jgi:G3E family GTPase|uniref:Cobalamin synthesis protein P47K n=2 Tax=Fischerella TaxID=1190 RepID=G6G052_9CYAN|nr:GTP-binding protein [Fischerella thermalis]PMB05037.1 cobalamin biosynthesis protein CobW [Fischerella thermalis CCMEE 5273]EHC08510.1 cobalamin synthesis protein P47K [Fischerella thermalis JSC-11]MBF1990248.1 GTP-binding protein [Fischerella thermalis M58_A2018_009]MBF2060378.1 GTP-binding protein [Fischerella thermalis M66_A2018_004]MBF2069952.1 GTP-binding protein [Fischerella thermalis M48_A2018_028]